MDSCHGTITMGPWHQGTMVPWHHGTTVTWLHGPAIPWYHGAVWCRCSWGVVSLFLGRRVAVLGCGVAVPGVWCRCSGVWCRFSWCVVPLFLACGAAVPGQRPWPLTIAIAMVSSHGHCKKAPLRSPPSTKRNRRTKCELDHGLRRELYFPDPSERLPSASPANGGACRMDLNVNNKQYKAKALSHPVRHSSTASPHATSHHN